MYSDYLVRRRNNFLEKANNRYCGKYSYSKLDLEFKNLNSIITITCPIHGDFKQRARKHLEGICPCPKCVLDKLKSKDDYKTSDWFIKEARKIHGDKYEYDLETYVDAHSKVIIYCPIHGEFEQLVHVHLKGHGCPSCSNCKPHTTESFISASKKLHGDKYDYSKTVYGKNNKEKVCIICPEHGEFWQTPHNHLHGDGCSKCLLKGQTDLYEFIKENFEEEKWEWEYTPSWLGLQKFDIYNIKHNFAIEYNGIQHYEEVLHFGGALGFQKTRERDLRKIQLCKENNCTLYIVKYDNVNYDKIRKDINNILNSNKNENC